MTNQLALLWLFKQHGPCRPGAVASALGAQWIGIQSSMMAVLKSDLLERNHDGTYRITIHGEKLLNQPENQDEIACALLAGKLWDEDAELTATNRKWTDIMNRVAKRAAKQNALDFQRSVDVMNQLFRK
jgi:predicted transcriptional regulator